MPIRRASCLAFVALLVFAGCGDDDPAKPKPADPPSNSFTGYMSDGTQSGKIVVTVSGTALAGRPRSIGRAVLGAPGHGGTAVATCTFGGDTITVSGTYDDEADSLHMTGSGYAFIGRQFPDIHGTPILMGDFTGPSGDGHWMSNGEIPAPRVYCGRWRSSVAPDSGTFNFVAGDTAFFGVAVSYTGNVATGYFGSISGPGPVVNLYALVDDIFGLVTVEGTLDLNTGQTSGTYATTDPYYSPLDNGTWSGELCP